MTQQTIVLDEKRNVTLTCYLQPVGGKFEYVEKRPAMLILPGGAYQYCSDREADPVAFAYLKAGYQVFILRYSVAENCAWPAPLMDYDQAMGIIRNKAEEWNVYPDKIAVLGFSAGGHLAAAAATMGMQRPNAALLGYAVTGNEVKACNPTAPDCCGMVDDKTCPCFVFAARDDNVVPVMNSVRFIEALTEKGIAYESHIYSRGGHGFSTADISVQNPNTEITCRAQNWVEDSLGWLEEVFGTYDGKGGFTEPKIKAHLNGNYEEYLSAECTVSYLLKNAESKEILQPLLNSMQNIKAADDTTQQEMLDLISEVKLSDLLKFAGAPADAEEKLDAQLRRIPNAKNET